MKPKTQYAIRNMQYALYAVILAGGAGERLWPVSRTRNPKYIMEIAGSKPLIQQTVTRLKGLVSSENILVVTTIDQLSVIRNNLKNIRRSNFLIEPYSKNTAAAIGLAATYIKDKNPDATMIVLPADHYIRDTRAFQSAIKKAVSVAKRGYLVTLGIRPSSPATGYGYIKTKSRRLKTKDQKFYYEVERFVEKPDIKTAKRFLRSNRFFWNSGIFIWKVGTVLKSIKSYMPTLYSSLLKTEESKSLKIYRRLKKISIDYGVMEKARNKAMIPANFDWADLGSWLSLEDMHKKDKNRNIQKGLGANYETENSIIVGSRNHLIATCGVKNLVIVHTKDATLVGDKSKVQEIKKLVELIRKKKLKDYL